MRYYTDLIPGVPVSFVVGTSSAEAVAPNPKRKGLVAIYLTSGVCSFGLDTASAIVNGGISLTQNGAWVMDEYTYTDGAINVISTVSGSILSLQEFS